MKGMVKAKVPKLSGGCFLGLPNIFTSKFKVSADFAKSEPKQLTEWEKGRTFYQVRESRKRQRKFILHDGPPYANGKAHAGHAVNKILKDMITKHQSLSGLDAPLILGWDCHGMPIEAQMMRASRVSVPSRLKLIGEARLYANQQMAAQFKDLRHLGLLVSRAESYLTMDRPTEAQEALMFRSLLMNGTVRRSTKPLAWCFSCKTNLAEAEVESQPTKRAGAVITFPFFRSRSNLRKTRKLLGIATEEVAGGVCIWTTTPWTLMANRTLSFNPNDSYVLAKAGQHLVVCSEGTLEQFVRDLGVGGLTVSGIIRGHVTSHLKFQHPFAVLLLKFSSPRNPMLDPTVRREGTGAVHIAPAHGIDDFQLFRTKLPTTPTNSVTRSGFHKSILLRREKVTAAGIVSLAWVNFTHNLVRSKVSGSTATECRRHQTETIVRSLTQWFLDASQQSGPQTWKAKILGSLRDAVFPFEADKQHLIRTTTTKPDWCLTRQRSWGVPVLILESKKTKNLHPFATGMMAVVSEEMRLLGIEAWTGACLLNFKRKESAEYQKVPDTLDVWFDSGTTWHVLKSNPMLDFPADLYLEGPDQFQGWFYSSLVTSVMLTGIPPTRTFISHGFVINDRNEKLSKSDRNFTCLSDLIRKEGADVLRLLVASLDFHKDMRLTNKCLDSASDCYKKIRNVFKFLLSNLSDFAFPADCQPTGSEVEIDAYLLLKTKDAQSGMRRQFDLFNFSGALKLLGRFCAEELGKFYFEVLKGRLYSSSRGSQVRKSAQASLYRITDSLLRSVVPLLPFAAEEVWHSFRPRKGTILKERYHPFLTSGWDLGRRWEAVRSIREENIRIVGTLRDRKTVDHTSAVQAKLSDSFPLYCRLHGFGPELKDALAASKTRLSFRIVSPNHIVRNLRLSFTKCIRCWQRSPNSCGSDHQPVCSYCKWSLQSKGEGRRLL